MNEAETRAELIDPALKAAGWGVVEGSRIRREYPITLGRLEGQGRRGKPLVADYVLEYRNTKLAVIEAKAEDEKLTEGVGQAKDYADKLFIRFTYSTNGKDYFTIYDFVKAHQHFSDPEWDGEPVEPEPCPKCGKMPCECVVEPPEACPECGKAPCECPKPPCPICGKRPCQCERKKRIKVKLAEGKDRNIQDMMATTFWHPDGTPISAQQFMELLFGKLPDFFQNEAELRALWSEPDTRAKLLEGLAEKGFGADAMAEMQEIIGAEKSDLFDVLAFVAYAMAPLTREERAARARLQITSQFNDRQQAFLAFVLAQYVTVGVGELDTKKLGPLLKLKYNNAIADAIADLGQPDQIREVFAGFQKYLYEKEKAPATG